MANNAAYILRLENIAKERSLTEPESRRLELLLKQQAIVPTKKPYDKLCFNGHLVEGKNAMPNGHGGKQCRKCHKKISQELDMARNK